GRVIISTGPFTTPELQKRFYQTLDAAIGQKPANCETNAFELVLREDKQRHRYLFALNPDTRETRVDRITIAGQYSRCLDLGIGSGVPISATAKDNETIFSLRLHPGE